MGSRGQMGATRRGARTAVLALAMLMLPVPGLAGSGEGAGDKGTNMVLDLLVLRPLGLLVTGVGSVAFVVSLPFTLPSDSMGVAACELVSAPLAYTFTRPLGDVEWNGRYCQDGASR